MRDRNRVSKTAGIALGLLGCLCFEPASSGQVAETVPKPAPNPIEKVSDAHTHAKPGPEEALCATLHRLVEAGRHDFSAVTGEEVKSLLSYHKTTISPPGAIEPCKILSGAIGKFVTCNMTPHIDREAAEAAFTTQRELVRKCIHPRWITRERSPSATEESVSFKESEKGISPAVEVHLKDRGQGKFQVQVWVQARSL